jgi:Domain of unknown function (DUF3885)
MSINQELKIFLKTNFNGLIVKQQLFYNWPIGLRFNLQTNSSDKEEYFEEVIKRSTKLFEKTFHQTDNLFIIFIQFKWRRRKIRFRNYFFKQIKGLNKREIDYKRITRLYEKNDIDENWNVATIKSTCDRLNFTETFRAIANMDFSRDPNIPGQVYLINQDKKIIFNMYDDRGLDIVSADKEALRPLYTAFDNWLLDYDRDEMRKRFE